MTLTINGVIAIGTFLVVLGVHTAALFYWGGSIRQMLRDHERRITKLET